MDKKELAMVGVTLASLGVIPFFFTDAFAAGFFGHEKATPNCSGYEECVTECAETGPSEQYCAFEQCAAEKLYGPTMVFECREAFADKGAAAK
ncbi:MAG: hypothetical protein VX899_13045 [Myxococcota bacterium]|nr:hypothetical protein [Myxococcota bacterium]